MYPTLKPSQRTTPVGGIPPQSAAAVVTSGWINAATFLNFLASVSVGALGTGATVDAKLQQATDSSGTGVKDIPGKALTQITKAANNDNTVSQINLQQTDLDLANGFKYFRLSITPAVAASLISGSVGGHDQIQGVASDNAAANLLQIVG